MQRIAVLYNRDDGLAYGLPSDAAAVGGVVACAHEISLALTQRGYDPVLIAAPRDPAALVLRLRAARVTTVFNLVESVAGDAQREAAVASLLELSKIAFTGSSALALATSLDKTIAKAILSAHGVPTPEGVLLARGDEPLPRAPLPWIVKPARQDASHGITRESVVYDQEAARARARFVISTYAQPALIEQFLPGRELNVAILGEGANTIALPPTEIDFSRLPREHPPLVTYEAKWDEASEAYACTPSSKPRALSPALAARLIDIALAAYRALRLRDYGRVDLRLDGDGDPRVLEVNPNPDLSRDAGLAKAARQAGIDYRDLIARIARMAEARHHTRMSGQTEA